MEYSLKEVASALGVPESNVRLYRDEFEEYLPVSGEGRRRRYPGEALALLRQIAARKAEGWTGGRIREELARSVQPGATARRRTAETRMDETIALLKAQAGEIALLRVEVAALRAEVTHMGVAQPIAAAASMEEVQRAALQAGGDR